MKFVINLLSLLVLFCPAGAQTKPTPSANKIPVDTISRNIIAAVKKVTAIAVNPKASAFNLATEPCR